MEFKWEHPAKKSFFYLPSAVRPVRDKTLFEGGRAGSARPARRTVRRVSGGVRRERPQTIDRPEFGVIVGVFIVMWFIASWPGALIFLALLAAVAIFERT